MTSVRFAVSKMLLNIKKLPTTNQTRRYPRIMDQRLLPRSLVHKDVRKPSNAARGSVTVEAALALSVFIMVTASLMSLFGILQNQSETFYRMDIAAEAMAGAGYIVDGSELGEKLKDMDLEFMGSAFSTVDDDILVRITYPERAAFSPWDAGTFLITQQVCRRAWTGRGPEEDGENDDKYVYVAENGSVYHVTESCTYLAPRVTAADIDTVELLRSRDGSKYYPCRYCGGEGTTIYITFDGNRYHSDPGCSRLKRTYSKVRLSETELPPCSKCAGADG